MEDKGFNYKVGCIKYLTFYTQMFVTAHDIYMLSSK